MITTEDLKAHRQNLSDEELEGVAGGAFGQQSGSMGDLWFACYIGEACKGE